MAILLTAHDVASALPYERAVDVLEEGFRLFARGAYAMPQRLVLGAPDGLLVVMPAADAEVMVVKVATVHAGNATVGLPTVQATVLVVRRDSGQVLSILDGTSLTVVRTAAASAVATRHLANEGPADLGVLGSGPLAIGHIRALTVVCKLRRVRIFSPQIREHWDAVKDQLSDLKLELDLADHSRDLVEESNILVLATTSREPVINWRWVKPGTHINATGSHSPTARELDSRTVANARVICDSVEACWGEAGDLLIAHAEGAIDRAHAATGLGDVVLGNAPGRQSTQEVTIFKSVGLAFQDLCAAVAAWNKAKQEGFGMTWNPNAAGAWNAR